MPDNASPWKDTPFQSWYRTRHIGGDISLGIIALAGYVGGLGHKPSGWWEWFVVGLIGAATVLKAMQSNNGATKLAVPPGANS